MLGCPGVVRREVERAPWAGLARGTDQRGGVDVVPAQRKIGAPTCGDSGRYGSIADQMGLSVDDAGQWRSVKPHRPLPL